MGFKETRWSYSRLKTFEECKYKYYLRYVLGVKEKDNFYASYGSYIHRLIEHYYKGEIKKEDLVPEFLMGFSENVIGERPKTVEKYINEGISYFSTFEPFEYPVMCVEQRLNWEIGGSSFTGFVDYVGKTDNGYCVIDHKSRLLEPRSKRKKPTKNDLAIDSMLKQLYLYGEGMKQKFGEYPEFLCLNCFRNGNLIIEPFDKSKCEEAEKWALDIINQIKYETEWSPSFEYFVCNNLCGISDDDCPWRNEAV